MLFPITILTQTQMGTMQRAHKYNMHIGDSDLCVNHNGPYIPQLAYPPRNHPPWIEWPPWMPAEYHKGTKERLQLWTI